MASSSSSSSCCPPQPTAVSKSVLVTLGPEDHTFNLHSSMRSVLRTVGEITQLYTMIKHKHSSLCFSILAPVKSSDVEVERAGVQRFLDTVTSIPNLTSDKDVQSFFESEFSFSPDFQITALMAPLHRSASQFAISVFVAQKEASDCDAQISILRTHIELVKEVFANLEQKIDLFITCSSEYEAVLIDLDSHLHEEAVLSDISCYKTLSHILTSQSSLLKTNTQFQKSQLRPTLHGCHQTINCMHHALNARLDILNDYRQCRKAVKAKEKEVAWNAGLMFVPIAAALMDQGCSEAVVLHHREELSKFRYDNATETIQGAAHYAYDVQERMGVQKLLNEYVAYQLQSNREALNSLVELLEIN